jgi:protein gp37
MAKAGWYWDCSFNPVAGCCEMSPGCRFCYSKHEIVTLHRETEAQLYADITTWLKGEPWFNGWTTAQSPGRGWYWPLFFRGVPNPVLGPGQPSIIFVCDMSDLLYAYRPAAHIQQVVDVMDLCGHVGLFLNKTVYRYAEFFAHRRVNPRLLLGFSAENQTWFDRRWPYMRPFAQQGWFVWVSLAPLLGPIRLPDDSLELLRWVICGGEEGPNQYIRETNPNWMRSLRDQCRAAGIPLFVKRMHGEDPIPPDLYLREFPVLTQGG